MLRSRLYGGRRVGRPVADQLPSSVVRRSARQILPAVAVCTRAYRYGTMDDTVDSNNNCENKYSLRPRTAFWRSEQSQENTRKSKKACLTKYRRRSANARERSRMREINEAFDALRRVVSAVDQRAEKMTKISTLRLAMSHITALAEVLTAQDAREGCVQPSASVWLPNTPDTANTRGVRPLHSGSTGFIIPDLSQGQCASSIPGLSTLSHHTTTEDYPSTTSHSALLLDELLKT